MVRLVQELKGVCKEGSLVGSVGDEVDCQESRQCGRKRDIEHEVMSPRAFCDYRDGSKDFWVSDLFNLCKLLGNFFVIDFKAFNESLLAVQGPVFSTQYSRSHEEEHAGRCSDHIQVQFVTTVTRNF